MILYRKPQMIVTVKLDDAQRSLHLHGIKLLSHNLRYVHATLSQSNRSWRRNMKSALPAGTDSPTACPGCTEKAQCRLHYAWCGCCCPDVVCSRASNKMNNPGEFLKCIGNAMWIFAGNPSRFLFSKYSLTCTHRSNATHQVYICPSSSITLAAFWPKKAH